MFRAVSSSLTLGNHAFNMIGFLAGIIELTFPDGDGNFVLLDSKVSLPARAAKITDLAATSLRALSAAIQFSIIDGALFAGRTVGVLALLDLSRDLLLVTSSTLTLWNFTVYETPDSAVNETEKSKRMWKIASSVRAVVTIVLAIGLVAVGRLRHLLYWHPK